MARYRKRPVEIEAVQYLYPASQAPEIAEWCGGKVGDDGLIYIPTLEGVMTVSINDFVIQGVQGEFYPCKPDIFAATYEAVEVVTISLRWTTAGFVPVPQTSSNRRAG